MWEQDGAAFAARSVSVRDGKDAAAAQQDQAVEHRRTSPSSRHSHYNCAWARRTKRLQDVGDDEERWRENDLDTEEADNSDVKYVEGVAQVLAQPKASALQKHLNDEDARECEIDVLDHGGRLGHLRVRVERHRYGVAEDKNEDGALENGMRDAQVQRSDRKEVGPYTPKRAHPPRHEHSMQLERCYVNGRLLHIQVQRRGEPSTARPVPRISHRRGCGTRARRRAAARPPARVRLAPRVPAIAGADGKLDDLRTRPTVVFPLRLHRAARAATCGNLAHHGRRTRRGVGSELRLAHALLELRRNLHLDDLLLCCLVLLFVVRPIVVVPEHG
jgi:hypothetical protein